MIPHTIFCFFFQKRNLFYCYATSLLIMMIAVSGEFPGAGPLY